jgi:hypothetical protein
MKPMSVREVEALFSELKFQNEVTLEHYRKGKLIHTQTGPNIFTTEGMANILNLRFGTVAKSGVGTVYGNLFKANITPGVGDTAAIKLGAAGTYQECQDADTTPATNRPLYVPASTTTAGITNTASKMEFTMLAALTLYGCFLALGQAKTDATAGSLLCAKRFTNPRITEITDVLAIIYNINLTSS